VNEKSEHHGTCHLEKYEHIRTLKISTNALINIDKVTCLSFLLELQAKTNQINSLNFMTQGAEDLKYLQLVDLS
jgi:hypothetical protein